VGYAVGYTIGTGSIVECMTLAFECVIYPMRTCRAAAGALLIIVSAAIGCSAMSHRAGALLIIVSAAIMQCT